MADAVASVYVDLGLNAASFQEGLKRSGKDVDAFGRKVTGLGGQLQRGLGSAADTFSRSLAGFGKGLVVGAAGAVAFTELPGAIRKIVAEGAGLVDTAAKIGVTTDALQELHFAATQGGASIEDMDKALGFLTKTVGQALDGTGEFAKVVAANGIALRDQAGQVRAPLAIIRDYAEVIKNAGSEQERARLTTIAFGRSGADLANVFRDGAAGIDASAASLRAMGGVIDGETLKQIAEIDDKWDQFTTMLETRTKSAILGVVAAMDDLSKGASRVPGLSVPITKDLQKNLPQNFSAEQKRLDAAARLYQEALMPFEAARNADGAFGAMAQRVLDLNTQLRKGEIGADKFAAGLDEVKASVPEFGPRIDDLKRYNTEINEAALAVVRLNNAQKQAAIPGTRTWVPADAGDRVRAAREQEGAAALAAASKEATMTEGERRLEAEMERLRRAIEKDHPDSIVTDAQIRSRAAQNIELAGRFKGLEDSFADSLSNMIAAAKDAGLDIAINSGFRTIERQAQLWEQALKKYGSPEEARKWVAPPGKSMHNTGMAADLGYGSAAARQWAHENAARYGLTFPLDNENWHVEPVGGRAGRSTSFTDQANANQDFGRSLADQRQSLELTQEEIDLRRQLGRETLANAEAYAEFRVAADLLAQAQQSGSAVGKELHSVNELLHGDLTKLSPAARQAAEDMRALAEAAGKQAAENATIDFTQSIDTIQRRAESVAEIGRDVVGGIISDLRQGKTAAEAFANALDGIADRLLDMALNAAFGQSGGGGGGFLANIIGAIAGGLGAPGLGGVYAEGGYTGNGGKHEPAGTVHRGEYVFSKAAVQRLGVGNLEAMHRAAKGYADGGFVGVPSIPTRSRAASMTIAPVYQIDARGSQMTEEQFRAVLRENNKQVVQGVRRSVSAWMVQDQLNSGGDYRT